MAVSAAVDASSSVWQDARGMSARSGRFDGAKSAVYARNRCATISAAEKGQLGLGHFTLSFFFILCGIIAALNVTAQYAPHFMR